MGVDNLISSPLNYTGGKYKLLPQLFPLFPEHVGTFVDLFCGGGNVGINVDADNVIFNDIDDKLVLLLNTFKNVDYNIILSWINEIIEAFQLSRVAEHGYGYYQCDSSKGLGSYNKEHFLQLRSHFNNLDTADYRYFIELYVLIVYAFNNQIRFNRNGQFNLPVGKRDFNVAMREKLNAFVSRLHDLNCAFTHIDFEQIDFANLTRQDFVYADPPYLITCATYNEGGGWNERKEHALYALLDKLHNRDIRFALSNVITSKGNTNNILLSWLAEHPEYTCHHLNYNYSNSNYQTKDRQSGSDEVLVTNY